MAQIVASTFTAEQVAEAEKAAQTLEALVGRLGHDDEFASALKEQPRQTLADAGLVIEKESMETLMLVDAERFDKACEALFDLVDSDFLISMSTPSCG
ncbi:Os1348 family NHLP clan protein [Streptomyces erythrochromogenes]|uniref:Os1348 family NHLP clan protein n=1 Tax=Streptomyces erythrochromogenes TaxID=285574 RepID=UPI00332E725D